MTSSADVVRMFFERMQARDLDGAAACLSPAVHIDWTATGERFDGPAFLAMQRAYPDGWSITVDEVLAVDDRVAAQVRVDHGDESFWCAGFYTVADGRIVHGVEHWVTAGAESPPEWRADYSS